MRSKVGFTHSHEGIPTTGPSWRYTQSSDSPVTCSTLWIGVDHAMNTCGIAQVPKYRQRPAYDRSRLPRFRDVLVPTVRRLLHQEATQPMLAIGTKMILALLQDCVDRGNDTVKTTISQTLLTLIRAGKLMLLSPRESGSHGNRTIGTRGVISEVRTEDIAGLNPVMYGQSVNTASIKGTSRVERRAIRR